MDGTKNVLSKAWIYVRTDRLEKVEMFLTWKAEVNWLYMAGRVWQDQMAALWAPCETEGRNVVVFAWQQRGTNSRMGDIIFKFTL